MTTIGIQGLEIFASVGVSEAERATGHRLQLDIEMDLATWPPACQSDSITETVDYGRVIAQIAEIVGSRSWHTLEFIAETIGQVILSDFTLVSSVQIQVSKPIPPVPSIVERVYVRHRVSRSSGT